MKETDSGYILYSLKEISKRAFQLAVACSVIGICVFAYYALLGLYFMAVCNAVFCFCIASILFLSQKQMINHAKRLIIGFVGLAFILFAAIEGSATGEYLYYFPLIVAIPIIVNNTKQYFAEVSSYLAFVIICFVLCVVVGYQNNSSHQFTSAQAAVIFHTNGIAAAFLTIFFSYVNVKLQHKYLEELIDQKNQTINSRTQFLSTMGHELRTPLNGIIGAVSLLKEEDSLPAQQEYFEILRYCSNHMLHQVNDVLDFNKIEAGKLEIHPVEVNLKRLLLNSVIPFKTMFEEKNIEIKVEIDPLLDAIVLADDVRLIQVLNNLLSNAVKFTTKGYVKLKATCSYKNDQILKAAISVEDTGNGIEKKDQKRIFESFAQVYDESTRKYDSSGLGLNICLRLLKLMHSNLELKSAKGIGSTFSFDIKLDYIGQQLQPEQDQYQKNADLEGIKILLVEDNHINMIIAQKILLGFKAECTKAFNGQEALALLKENAAYQIVLMDLEMPVMDGYTAIKEIKKNWPEIPVLAFTATLLDVDTLKSLKSIGFADCILKPFQTPTLLSQIKKYVLEPSLEA